MLIISMKGRKPNCCFTLTNSKVADVSNWAAVSSDKFQTFLLFQVVSIAKFVDYLQNSPSDGEMWMVLILCDKTADRAISNDWIHLKWLLADTNHWPKSTSALLSLCSYKLLLRWPNPILITSLYKYFNRNWIRCELAESGDKSTHINLRGIVW